MAILKKPVMEKILTHLGLDRQPPPQERAREPDAAWRHEPRRPSQTHYPMLQRQAAAGAVIYWRSIRAKQHQALLQAHLMEVYGKWQREGEVRNLVAGKLFDLTLMLGALATASSDFH